MSEDHFEVSEETNIVHGVTAADSTAMDLVAPIHMTSTYKFKSVEHGAKIFDGTGDGYVYTRIANPTVDLLQRKMAVLEDGDDAIATASGMSAIAAAILSLTKPGDNFVSCNSVYGGTFALFNSHLKGLDIQARFISPASCCSLPQIEDLIDKHTRLLFLETPANPTLDVIDIAMWADIAKKHAIPLIVDNTFATSYLQKPLQKGADIVIHSATKYLGGHGDVIAGVIIGSSEMIRHIRGSYTHHYGPAISPFNAWLILRGIKTLALRMNRHSGSALKIAHWLQGHPKVTAVYYPGLQSHRGYAIAVKQMKQFSGMIAFEVCGGLAAGKRIMNSVRLCILAVSLGDCETLIQHPASMTHSTYTKQERGAAGITDGLIRLSVGLEDPDDIIADLAYALSKVRAASVKKK